MAIYTKGGDKGKTSLFDGLRVEKDSIRVETYGTFDELNANISLADKFCKSEKNKKILQTVEYRMFYLQGEIATKDTEKFLKQSQFITDDDTRSLEKIIDDYTQALPPIHSFILPGSSTAGAQLHVCRTICRRAERSFVKLSKSIEFRPELERYVNRLSDFLYIMARSEDYEDLIDDVTEKVIKVYSKIEDGRKDE
ncbi:cobalamin adenosyltransferase [Levilactobacillus koreensis JCM 16448]|uniref:Corrinoid adenosyltransferase n=1 Tax=Levilactobacillus koreensis TaxID=637971 RepID=A0AAC8UXB6_9LACO|nr:cob(I)yrinic acid a,c-diamide adenosyltransferase [Levilactobacillus koreensis]AKP65392.1 ATP--cobalamin adenosyltransferase [Levilactobacillus koreensis]KRK91016.1 cobalamin adenosyltransferase [Levilactobacillus koreensis JCM 16448]